MSEIFNFFPRRVLQSRESVTLSTAAAEDDYVEEKRKINFSILISVIMPLDIAV